MGNTIAILFLIIPFLSALGIACTTWLRPKLAYNLTVLALGATLFYTVSLFKSITQLGVIQYKLGNWKPPIGIEFLIDPLNALVLLMIAFVAFWVAVYSKKLIERELPGKEPLFYTLFLLLVTGLMGITATGDAFNLYVLIEVSALTSYALLALKGERGYLSTFNYLIMGTLGACFYLLGVGYLLIKTGTLNMVDISNSLMALYDSKAILIAFTLIMLGVWVKMALFPFHSWLPNVYTFSPTVSACLAAPLMTKVSVYVMIRMMTSVFPVQYVYGYLNWQPFVMWIAVASIIFGAIVALAQTNIKRMLTYLIVSEIGYMVGGAWLGNKAGLTGTIYHIGADGLMTATLFMAVGAFAYYSGGTKLNDFKGIFKKMPLTSIAFLVGAFSMIGIPPTPGFFTKWYLISGAYQAGVYHFMVALLVSSLINAVLFFRIIEVGFFNAMPSEQPQPIKDTRQEAPMTMVTATLVMAAGVMTFGFYTKEIVGFINLFLTIKGF